MLVEHVALPVGKLEAPPVMERAAKVGAVLKVVVVESEVDVPLPRAETDAVQTSAVQLGEVPWRSHEAEATKLMPMREVVRSKL